MREKRRLFVDMDGTLAVFHPVDTLETLYEPGYFSGLEPQGNVLDAVRLLLDNDDLEVYVLSAVLSDSKYAQTEKNEWLDRYLPEIDQEHRIFLPCGADKKDYVPSGIDPEDVLLDDYTVNLMEWDPPSHAIKLLNGINGTHGTWQSDRVSIERSARSLALAIEGNMFSAQRLEDPRPQEQIPYERLQEIAKEAVDLLTGEDLEEELADRLELTEDETDLLFAEEKQQNVPKM